jgi:hypothetical protein
LNFACDTHVKSEETRNTKFVTGLQKTFSNIFLKKVKNFTESVAEEPQPIFEFGLFPEKPAIYKTLVEQHTDK